METRTNEEVRSNCPHCGDTRERLYTKAVRDGSVQYCHNCQYRGFIRGDKQASPKSVLERAEILFKTYKTGETIGYAKHIQLPHDFTLDLPDKALAWLYKYQITDEEIRQFRFGWSQRLKRLILPVYRDDQLVYYQGRTFDPITKINPKYLNIRQSGAKNVYFLCSSSNIHNNSIVMVEDILSAIKVGRQFNSIALLGSYLPDSMLPVFKKYNKVFIWLDADKYKESIKMMQKLGARGTPTRVISTPKDPKENSDEYINHRIYSLL